MLEHAELRCFTCRETFPASTVPADRLTRLEGASDPSDMVVVIPVTCPHCSTSGSLVLNDGAEASVDEADALVAMERRPASDEHPVGGIGPLTREVVSRRRVPTSCPWRPAPSAAPCHRVARESSPVPQVRR